jgi:ubiquitin-activating enzyme E1
MSMNNKKNTNNVEIDESLYSRQLYVLGHEAMKNMSQSKILISGMGGLGLELAKNVILSGVKSVTVHDLIKATNNDLSSQFYLTENDLGSNRALVVRDKLAELNMYVEVNSSTEELSEELIKNYDVVVLTNNSIKQQIQVNNWTRSNNTKFISTKTLGLFGQIFCDFGKEFIVNDTDGEQPLTSIVVAIDSEGIVTCSDTSPHGLTNSDRVELDEVKGLNEINGKQFNIKVLSATSFKLLDFSSPNQYKSGGIVKQLKFPEKMSFKSMEQSILEPEFILTDFENFDRGNESHVCFQAFEKFQQTNGRYPKAWNQEDAETIYEYAKELSQDISSEIVKKFSYCCSGNIAPIQSVIGSIAAQEVIKACSHKFKPINQWLYFDSLNCLPENEISEEQCSNTESRYQGQIDVFGQDFQDKLMDQNWFVVGAGAIGCELLKNFAMIGLGCREGNVTITDMDTIEKSNLNRQFLFRSSDIGQAKSTSAAKAIKRMNPEFNITAQMNKVCPENESFYDYKFFDRLDGVANALDNIQARLYVDKQCVLHGKPLVESGTLGTKGNTQVVIPGVTESYGSTQDPPEKSIPVCTIKNFPNAIEHTIQWARDEFEGLFTKAPQNVELFVTDPDSINALSPADKNDLIKDVKDILVDSMPKDFKDCLEWSFLHWHQKYRNDIANLIDKFPADTLTSSGLPFWSAGKRCPHSINFDIDNSVHLNYITAASNLRASIFGLPCNVNINQIKEMVNSLTVPKFVTDSNFQVSVTDEEEKNKEIKELSIDDLPNSSNFESLQMYPQEFEKDDDTNFHVDFITAASNMRAQNYDIEIANKHKTKGIAGKIIPAIATTTSLVAGLVTLELYKIVQGHKKVEQFRSGFINLALPYFGFADPIEASKYELNNINYTLWDHIKMNQDMTLEEFNNYFKKEYDVDVCTITCGVTMLYAFFLPIKDKNEKISSLIKRKVKSKKDMYLLTVIDENDEKDVPQVKFIIPSESSDSLMFAE